MASLRMDVVPAQIYGRRNRPAVLARLDRLACGVQPTQLVALAPLAAGAVRTGG